MSKDFSEELKTQILEEYRNGRSVRELAADYEPQVRTIQEWIRKEKVEPRLGEETQAEEIDRLRRENRRLQEEVSIFKKSGGLVRQSEQRTVIEVRAVYRFIQAHQASGQFSVSAMCRVFEVLHSSMYSIAWPTVTTLFGNRVSMTAERRSA